MICRRTLLATVATAAATEALAQPFNRGPPRDALIGPLPGPEAPGAQDNIGPRASAQPPGATLDLAFTGPTLPAGVTLTRGSDATYFDAAGVMQTATGDTPRFDYDPVTHVARGLLIEEARTNLLLRSAIPDSQSVAVTAQSYALSFYGPSSSFISVTGPASGFLLGAAPARAIMILTPTADGTLTVTIGGALGAVRNAQLEAGAFATSYVATTAAAAATRNQDTVTMSTGVSWFNANAGTMVAEYDYTSPSSVICGLTAGTFSNSFYLTQSTVVGVIADAITSVDQSTPAIIGGVNKSAGVYDSAALIAGCINAGSVSTGTMTGGAPYPWTATMGIGCPPWPQAGGNIDGHMRRVRYWPRALSRTELQQATR